jgi:hypothetical protein
MNLTNIYRILLPTAAQYTFSSAHKTFSKMHHILGHKVNLNKCKLKYLVINLTVEVTNINNENYKSLKKGINKASEDGRTSHAHGSAGATLWEWPYF